MMLMVARHFGRVPRRSRLIRHLLLPHFYRTFFSESFRSNNEGMWQLKVSRTWKRMVSSFISALIAREWTRALGRSRLFRHPFFTVAVSEQFRSNFGSLKLALIWFGQPEVFDRLLKRWLDRNGGNGSIHATKLLNIFVTKLMLLSPCCWSFNSMELNGLILMFVSPLQ